MQTALDSSLGQSPIISMSSSRRVSAACRPEPGLRLKPCCVNLAQSECEPSASTKDLKKASRVTCRLISANPALGSFGFRPALEVLANMMEQILCIRQNYTREPLAFAIRLLPALRRACTLHSCMNDRTKPRFGRVTSHFIVSRNLREQSARLVLFSWRRIAKQKLLASCASRPDTPFSIRKSRKATWSSASASEDVDSCARSSVDANLVR